MKKNNVVDFLKSIYHISSHRKNIKEMYWTFYNENDELIILFNENSCIQKGGKQYIRNKWFTRGKNFKIINRICDFVKQNKYNLLKMDKIVKNNFVIKNRLNKLLKDECRFTFANYYGWKYDDEFYMKIDFYKSCLQQSIYIRMDNQIYQKYDNYVDFRTMFKILEEINIKKKNVKTQINDIVDKVNNINLNDELKIVKVENISKHEEKIIDHDEIRKNAPELFIKKPIQKRLESQSCKNFWDFINFEQMVD